MRKIIEKQRYIQKNLKNSPVYKVTKIYTRYEEIIVNEDGTPEFINPKLCICIYSDDIHSGDERPYIDFIKKFQLVE